MVRAFQIEELDDPYEILVAAIFNQALEDCKKPIYHQDVIEFAKSKWCQTLLLNIISEKEIEEIFLEEMKKAKKDDGCGVNLNPYKLIRKRRTQGYSQARVAKYVGTNPMQISFWENGVKRPSAYNVEKLCKLFECTVDDLM